LTISRYGPLMALMAACVIPVIWPGDIPFINDEPLLVINAVRANQAHTLAQRGLLGTFGFVYGPFPVWVYQALTVISHDLVVVALLHSALIACVTAGALWWISRTLGLWSSFGLRVTVAAMIAMLLVHLMAVALVIPLGVHMFTVRVREVWKHRISLAIIVLGGVALAWPYWHSLAARQAPGLPGFSTDGLFFPLFGGRLLSARQLEYFFGWRPVTGATLHAAARASWIAYLLVWGGIVLCVRRVIGGIRHGEWTPRTHIAAISIAALVCQSAIDAVSGKFQHPQYYNGTWIVFVLLAWFAVDSMMQRHNATRRAAVATTGLLAGSLLVAVSTIAVRLHHTRGTREVYGPTIANQQRVARVLARYSPASRVVAGVSLYERYPHTLAVLRELNPDNGADRPAQQFEIRYTSDDPASGAIEIVPR
jgi:hypothetical protein